MTFPFVHIISQIFGFPWPRLLHFCFKEIALFLLVYGSVCCPSHSPRAPSTGLPSSVASGGCPAPGLCQFRQLDFYLRLGVCACAPLHICRFHCLGSRKSHPPSIFKFLASAALPSELPLSFLVPCAARSFDFVNSNLPCFPLPFLCLPSHMTGHLQGIFARLRLTSASLGLRGAPLCL